MGCFLAVPLEEPALSDVQTLMATLRSRVHEVRWVRPETLHLTIHFFGAVGGDAAEAGLRAVAPVVEASSRFTITLDALGWFAQRDAPRVLWLGATAPQPALEALASGCRAALRGAGFAVEERPYRAHCTLGRPGDRFAAVDRAGWEAAAAEAVEVRAFSARRLVLFESHSAPGGSLHLPRAQLALGAEASNGR